MLDIFDKLIIRPVIPVWVMAIICVGIICLKRRGVFGFILQIFISAMLFMINLRVMYPSDNIQVEKTDANAYVVFIIDDTISMLADDMEYEDTRLEAVKRDCKNICEQLYGAKFTVLTFNNNSNILCPYTNDLSFIENTIDAIQPLSEYYARGTSLSVCVDDAITMLELARNKAEENGEDARFLLFYISDGETNTDEKDFDDFEELMEYCDDGAVLGYGTEDGGNMYIASGSYDYGYYYNYEDTGLDDDEEENKYPIYDNNGDIAVSKYNEENLNEIAGYIELDYIHMEEPADINDKIEQILDGTLKTPSDEDETQGFEDTYFYFAMVLAVLLVIDFIWVKKGEYYV